MKPPALLIGAAVLVALLIGLGVGKLTTPSAPAAQLPHPAAAPEIVPITAGSLPPTITARKLGTAPTPTPKPKSSGSTSDSKTPGPHPTTGPVATDPPAVTAAPDPDPCTDCGDDGSSG